MPGVTLATLGSLGDLLPMLAVARALRARKVQVVIAASPRFRETVLDAGVRFAALGNDVDPMRGASLDGDASVAFIENANFSQLDRVFEDLLAAASGTSALVSPYHVVPAHLVAERLGIPYIATAFSPAHLVPANADDRDIGWRIRAPAHWHTALSDLRRRCGMSRVLLPYSAVFNSATALLGLFPQFLRRTAHEFPKLQVLGFPHPSGSSRLTRDLDMEDFCDERTVVVSFGSYVDRIDPRRFFEESAAACRSLGWKCLYLSTEVAREHSGRIAPAMMVRPFVDHDLAFARAGAVVHHGGIGTLMAACRHRKPMVVVPFFYDQPYHAARMNELIGSSVISPASYDRSALERALRALQASRDATVSALNQLMAAEVDGADPAATRVGTISGEYRVHDA